MRHWGMLLLGSCLAAADLPSPATGVLLERDPQTASGQFSVRLPDHLVLRYRFDARTTVDRNQQLIDVARLKPGEKVEVASEPIPGLVLRHATAVRVIAEAPAPVPITRALPASRIRSANRYIEDRSPVGNLTYSGVVSRVNGDRIILHLRDGAEQSLLLRKDTRYLLNGDLVDAAVLKLNTPVFVRAGRDLWDQVEAYQVIWGRILAP
jgi:hypothetical protein